MKFLPKIRILTLLTLFFGAGSLQAQYCSFGINNGVEPITMVDFAGINNTSPAALSSSAYEDFTTMTGTVAIGQSYPIILNGNSDGSWDNTYSVYIDWDQDGQFNSTDEKYDIGMLTNTNGLTPSQALNGNIQVPSTALGGNTIMRVAKQYYSGGGSYYPPACGTVDYGQAEDYTLTVTGGTPCSATPSAGTIPLTLGVCPTNSYAITLTGATAGVSGLTRKWQSRNPAGTGAWQDIPGATMGFYTIASAMATPTDYRYIIACGTNADTSNILTTTINPSTQCYCNPSVSYTDYFIDTFQTFGGDINVSNLGSGLSSGGYGDFAGSDTLSASLGTSISFSAKFGPYATTTFGTKIWVDYNQNGSFNDPGEMVYSTSNYTSNPLGSFVIPPAATVGTTRMRVGADVYESNGPVGSCATLDYGEFEDYTVIITAPTCYVASGLNVTNVTATTANINWTAASVVPALGYQYYLSTSNSYPTAITIPTDTVAAGILTKSLSSLTPNTTYYVWVRSSCNATDKSSWTPTTTFKTLCTVSPAPFVYDVETQVTTTNSSIVDCWTSSPTANNNAFRWDVVGNGGTTPSSATGPASAHSGNKYFYTEASSGSQGDTAKLTSPGVDVTALTLPMLEFYYHMYGSYMGKLYVQASDGTTWNTVDSLIGQQQTSENAPWSIKRIVLPGYTGILQVRFLGVRGSDYEGDMSIDDITVKESPTCFEPTALTLVSATQSAGNISWTAPFAAPASGYEYYRNTTGVPPTSSTVATGSVAPGLTTGLGTLTASTTYFVWVRSVCSASDKSEWSQMLSFTTLQVPATIPYTENFTTTGTNWTLINGSQTNKWIVGAATGNTGNALYITNDAGTSNAYSTGSPSIVQAFRDITFPTGGSNTFKLTFDWKCNGEGTTPYFYDYFKVWLVPISYIPTPGTQITAGAGMLQIGAYYNNNSTWSTTGEFIIPQSFSGTTSRLVYEWTNDGGSGSQPPAAIDNVNIVAIPLCTGTPSVGSITVVDSICAGVSFDLTSVVNNSVGGMDYQWQETPTGTNTWTDIAGAITPIYTLTNGASVSSDYRLIATCTNSNNSDTSNVEPVGLYDYLQCYCIPVYVNGCIYDDDIKDVILTGDVAPGINNLNTPCSGNGYTDYTSMSTNLTIGNSYSGNVTTSYDYPDENVQIWIDYNLDGLFDASESIATISNMSNASTGAFSFTVPANISAGIHRMRIRLAYSQIASDIDPCSSYSYGEAQDYMVNIVAACDNPVVNLGNDTAICAGASLTLDAGNAGLDFLWNDNSTGQTLAVTSAGAYSVTVTDGNCSTTDTVNVAINPLPSADGIVVTDEGGSCSFTFGAENAENATGYNWNFGDGSTNIAGATAAHSYDENGSYVAVLTMTNDCGTTTLTTTVECSGVGIKNVDLGNDVLKLYPNPTSDKITIENTSDLNMEYITVFNVLGQVVYQNLPQSASKHQLNVAKMASGLYNVRIKTNKGMVIRKFEILK